MKSDIRFKALLALGLLLTGCQKEQKKEEERATAAGEILPGSASDAMLPLDTVRSQPPLAPQVTASGKSSADGRDEQADANADPTEEPATAPSPAAGPATGAAAAPAETTAAQ